MWRGQIWDMPPFFPGRAKSNERMPTNLFIQIFFFFFLSLKTHLSIKQHTEYNVHQMFNNKLCFYRCNQMQSGWFIKIKSCNLTSHLTVFTVESRSRWYEKVLLKNILNFCMSANSWQKSWLWKSYCTFPALLSML